MQRLLRGFTVSLVLIPLAIAGSRSGVLAIDPRFELDIRNLDKKTEPVSRKRAGREKKKRERAERGTSEYSIRPGDHIFKILMRDYGLSNSEAEALIPEVKRLNGISDIRGLRVGQTIRIPLAKRGEHAEGGERPEGSPATERAEKVHPPVAVAGEAREKASPPVGHSLRMTSLAAQREPDGVDAVRQVWDRLVPTTDVTTGPIEIKDKNFSLSLDPTTFPSFPAADGGRVVVDARGKLPPLVKALIEEKDPSIRIVSESPQNRKRFMASLLAGAKFYSVEENFAVDFGADPKLTVRADYKIEKTPESLLRHDVVLMNVSDFRHGMPPSLVSFLRQEGFQVLEAVPPTLESSGGGNHTLHQISAKGARGVVDALLRALSLHYEADRNVELYGLEESGVRLFVKADRYFEEKGERFVVSYFDGDPVNYTLMRLLETRGYKVVMLEEKDDFRRIAEKFFTRLRISGYYAKHDLWPLRDAPYSVQMSGFLFRSPADRGSSVFLTNTDIDPLFRDLLDQNGYSVVSY